MADGSAAAAVNAGLVGPVQDGGCGRGAHKIEAGDDEIGELLEDDDGIIDIQDSLPQDPPAENVIELD
jgi:hypothetical protein